MDKEQRDQLRKVLEFYPGDIIPVPGSTKTIIELIDQIDKLEKERDSLQLQVESWNSFGLNLLK